MNGEKIVQFLQIFKKLIREKRHFEIFIIILSIGIVSFIGFKAGQYIVRIDQLEKKYEVYEEQTKKIQELQRNVVWIEGYVKGYLEGYSDKKLKDAFDKLIKELTQISKK